MAGRKARAGSGEAGRRKAVFLDRDGVLVRSEIRGGRPHAVRRLEDFEIYPDAAAALAALRDAGFLLIVATNQPDVAQGLIGRDILEAMHERLRAALPLDGIEVCLHTDADKCECRKPKPGMLLSAAKRWPIDLARSYMVGDRWRDIEAGKAAGCRTILVERGYDESLPSPPDFTVESVAAACRVILRDSAA